MHSDLHVPVNAKPNVLSLAMLEGKDSVSFSQISHGMQAR